MERQPMFLLQRHNTVKMAIVPSSRQEFWSGVRFPAPAVLPDPGVKPSSLASPALAGGLFATSGTYGLPRRLGSKEPAGNAGDLGSLPGPGGAPGEGNRTPLQYSGLENPTDRRAWWATVPGVAQSQT